MSENVTGASGIPGGRELGDESVDLGVDPGIDLGDTVEAEVLEDGFDPRGERDERDEQRDLAEVPAVEVIGTLAVHLMSAAAVKLGLAEGGEDDQDLDEARKLITALAGLVTAAAPEIGSQHAGPLRDGLRTLQLAFREASVVPDEAGMGPGEKFTGAVFPRGG